MYKILLFLGMSIVALACEDNNAEDCIDEQQIDPNAICTQEYAPVCGCDGQTYGNECEARNNGITKWEQGTCEEGTEG